jgi:hypothetical protein
MQLAASPCKTWIRLAVSRLQIVPEWPPVTCKLYPCGRQSHAINKIEGNLLRLAATRVQFECNWPPDASNICIGLAATREQFVCDWPPDASNFCIRLAASLVRFVCDWPLKVIERNRIECQSYGLYKLFYCCYFMPFFTTP